MCGFGGFWPGLPALFLGAVLVQSVFATTYVINDGGRTFSCTLYTASTREALSAAGVELTEADVYTREADTIYVCRAPTVTLTYHGKSSTVVSEEETVRQLLDRLGIQLAQDDVLSLPAYTVLQRGMELRIDRVESREEVFTREIPRQTRTLWAPELPQGVEEVLNPGQDGALECRAWVTYVNGQETQREVLEQRQTVPAVDCLIARGSRPGCGENAADLADRRRDHHPAHRGKAHLYPGGSRPGHGLHPYGRGLHHHNGHGDHRQPRHRGGGPPLYPLRNKDVHRGQ